MVKRKYENPRTKARARPDAKSLEITIPEAIVYGYRISSGDKLEWILVKEGMNEYVKIVKVQD